MWLLSPPLGTAPLLTEDPFAMAPLRTSPHPTTVPRRGSPFVQAHEQRLLWPAALAAPLRDSCARALPFFYFPLLLSEKGHVGDEHLGPSRKKLKIASLKLAKEYMNRVVNALKSDPFANDEELLLQGVRFAFRIHQLAGGFDEGCRKAFQELKTYASKSE